ncbi:MAG TPA: hypothetical protein VGM06_02385 [Polyangiaceae bacterium]
MSRSAVALGVLFAALLTLAASNARAADETDALFASGVAALHDGRPGDAVSAFEALADRGVVDPVASYDRGLAYVGRVRIGAEVPGDLGRAAHGFEEARDLARDGPLADDAGKALMIVRSEVARRRVRAGQPVEVDPGRSLSRSLARLLSEDTWSALAVASAAGLAVGLFVRWLGRAVRVRVGGGVAAAVAGPVLAVAVVMTLAMRHDRMYLREAVVVGPNARPTDEHGLAVPGATPLPQGARVEVVDASGPWQKVRFGAIEVRVAASSLRELARAD